MRDVACCTPDICSWPRYGVSVPSNRTRDGYAASAAALSGHGALEGATALWCCWRGSKSRRPRHAAEAGPEAEVLQLVRGTAETDWRY